MFRFALPKVGFAIILAGSESPTFQLLILRIINRISSLDPKSLGSFEDHLKDCPMKIDFYLHSYQSSLSMSQKNIIVETEMLQNTAIAQGKIFQNKNAM